MINKYKDAYSEIVLALIEIHNAHLAYLEGPNTHKSNLLKRRLNAIIPKLKELRKVVTNVNKEVKKRTKGIYPAVPNDPELLTPEFHAWVGKGLGRVKKYTPRNKK